MSKLKPIAIILLILELGLFIFYLISVERFTDRLPMLLGLLLLIFFIQYTYYEKPIPYFTSSFLAFFLTGILFQAHYLLAGDHCTYHPITGDPQCAMPISNLLISSLCTAITVPIFIRSYYHFQLYQSKNTHRIGYLILIILFIFALTC